MLRFERSGVVRLSLRLVLATALLLMAMGNQLALAQQEFDLPELDDYSGLQAITANSVDGVNVRAEPGVDSEIVISVPDGNIVDLRVDKVRTVTTDDGIRWWPISIWGVDGWVAGMYLAPVDGETSGDTSSDSSGDAAAPPAIPAGRPAITLPRPPISSPCGPARAPTNPGSPGSARATWSRSSTVPSTTASTDWWLITDGSINAYVFGGYLKTASELDLEAPAADAPAFAVGDTLGVMLGSGGANVRKKADASSKRIGSLNEGAIVTVVDGPTYDSAGGAWYLVDLGDDTRGYVTGEVFEEIAPEDLPRPRSRPSR